MPPTVASYCTTFLKPEMQHIYRQITGVQESPRFKSFVITRERIEAARYPFDDIEVQPRLRSNFIRRAWLKYVEKQPAIVYRGEYQILAKILERRRVDLLHVYFGHTGVHLLPILQRWQAQGGVPLVSFHGMDIQPRADEPGYEERLRELLRVVPLVMARSESLIRRLEELGCPREKIRLNRTGIPLERFPRVVRGAPADGAWKLVQACRLIEKKGLPTTLRAFAALRAEFPRATLTIGGDGPLEKDLRALAAELGVADAVRWPGFLDEAQLNALYADSHILLHPSQITADQNQEGVPNAMLEAMSTGLPVLATVHGGIPEAVTEGRSGFLVAERDPETLGARLLRIARDPGLWARLAAGAADEVREKFGREAAIVALLDIYAEALALRAARA